MEINNVFCLYCNRPTNFGVECQCGSKTENLWNNPIARRGKNKSKEENQKHNEEMIEKRENAKELYRQRKIAKEEKAKDSYERKRAYNKLYYHRVRKLRQVKGGTK